MATNVSREDWQRYILGPRDAVVEPVRWARVPWGQEPFDEEKLNWKKGNGFLELPTGEEEAVLLDFGVKTTGHLLVECENAHDIGIDTISGPHPKLTRFGKLLQVHTGAGIWRDADFRALRFLKVRSTSGSGIRVRFKLEFTGWPGDYQGHFLCNEDLLNRIWYIGAYTIQICTQPHEVSGCYTHLLPRKYGDFPKYWRSKYGRYCIWDAPRRDREVWIGDMWPEAHGLLYSFHAPEVIKTSLAAVAENQYEDGLIPGSGISLQRFSEYACWWMALLDRLYLMTGDIDFVRDMEPHIRKLMVWLKKEIERYDGFLEVQHRQTWAWTLMRRGAVTGSQCVAVAAARGGGNIMKLLGDDAEAEELYDIADELSERIRTQLWDSENGTFRDCLVPPDGVRRVSCDSNALPSLFHIATPDQTKLSLKYLQDNLWTPYGTRTIVPPEPEENWNWAHNHNVWPFVVGLELEARFERGELNSAMELMRTCWGNMVKHETSTFWEMVSGEDGDFVTHRPVADIQGPEWDSWDSFSHGWSAAPTYLMQAFLMGVRPLEPGFRKFLFAPQMMDLKWIEGSVPTPHGPITVSLDNNGAGLKATIHIPEGTEALCRIDGNEWNLAAGTHEVST